MKKTIIEAIKEVMLATGKPMAISEVYEGIVKANLYTFKADQPLHIVRNQIRRHCKGVDFPSASDTKHFELLGDGKYWLLQHAVIPVANNGGAADSLMDSKGSRSALQTLHQQYVDEFRQRVLEEVKAIDPGVFEQFCRNLLVAYGFRDVVVTRVSKDGGIDGHGRLKLGFAYF